MGSLQLHGKVLECQGSHHLVPQRLCLTNLTLELDGSSSEEESIMIGIPFQTLIPGQ